MNAEMNPGVLVIAGALLMPILPHMLRGAWGLLLPVLVGYYLLLLPMGTNGELPYFDLQLVTLRIDRLSFLFGTIFLIAAFLAGLFSLHVRSWLQPTAALMYAGSAIGAVFAGDLITFFVFWEITAITSVFLIWAQSTEAAFASGMRYLIIQVSAGVLLLAGVMIHTHAGGDAAFDQLGTVSLGQLDKVPLAIWLILIAFGVKAAFPLLHNWLHDAYPAATPTGTVWLSAFTTKLAIYALIRGFPGSDILIPIGAAMALGMIVYAALENDIRRILSYALNSQLGFMVIGVGVGTELALNGAAAHAFCSTLYQALLFMAAAAVIHRTGTGRLTELGGLARLMPWTTALMIVGSLSIAAAPMFSGFVSKSLIMSAAMKYGYFWAWLAMVLASGAVVLHAGIKLPFFTFFNRETERDCDEAPANMVAAMALTAALCLAIGLMPDQLYALLPFDVAYAPYTSDHIVSQLQILAFGALAFLFLHRYLDFPKPQRGIYLDFDWVTRIFSYNLASTLIAIARSLWNAATGVIGHASTAVYQRLDRSHNPDGLLGREWPTGLMAFWATFMLAAYLFLFYFRQFTQ